MGKVIGIDLGTTNSCVAVMEGSEAKVITNPEGGRTTPSIVAVSESGERMVGQIAKRQAITNPENTVFAVKRLIGRQYASKEVQDDIKILPYKIEQAKNGDVRIKLRGKLNSPAEISSFILANIKHTAEEYLGEKVTDAVVTVPAYFNDSQRQATKDAGKIAGLNVLRIINEPTAASLAYGMDKKKEEKIAVFDLGGGTFDISILEIGKAFLKLNPQMAIPILEVKTSTSDLSITSQLSSKKIRGSIFETTKWPCSGLKRLTEKAKMELSTSMETDVNLPFITADASGSKHLNIKITRAKLEGLVSDLLDKLEQPCRIALKDAGLSPNNIDEVILVGGMTRMPAVQERVKNSLEKNRIKGLTPTRLWPSVLPFRVVCLKEMLKMCFF